MPSFVGTYAVVQVNPTIEGTDETKGKTVLRGISHDEATFLKMGMLKGLRHAGWTIEDGWAAFPPSGVQGTPVGLLICTIDRAPKMEEER